MSTYTYHLIDSLDDRWHEVELIVNEAALQSSNIELYNALCRTSIVLITAHLEGFTKEIAKSIIDDINSFSDFSKIPMPIKRTYCSMYLDIDNNNLEKKINILIDTFDSLGAKLCVDAFVFDNNKNPSPLIIDKICKNFGVSNFFEMIEESLLDKVFEGEKSIVYDLLQGLKYHTLEGIKEFPYTLNPEDFEIDIKKKNEKRTLWETFLDELLKKRHAIAHGTSLENSSSIEEIREIKTKVQILQYAFALILCNSILLSKK